MSLVEKLLDNAYQDTQLLIGNEEKGDDSAIYRDVEFIFYAHSQEKAELVASFIDDNRYGASIAEKVSEKFRVTVTVNMPTTQNIACSVSGLMACIAELFGIEYDGWGCKLQCA